MGKNKTSAISTRLNGDIMKKMRERRDKFGIPYAHMIEAGLRMYFSKDGVYKIR